MATTFISTWTAGHAAAGIILGPFLLLTGCGPQVQVAPQGVVVGPGPGTGVDVGNQDDPLQKPWVVQDPTVIPPVQFLPQPTPSQEPKVEYFHLTTTEYATDIVFNGVRPFAAGSSGNDPRFFAFTLAPRYSPLTTKSQLKDMLDEMESQLSIRYPGADLSAVQVVLPEKVVASLERSGQLHYGPFFRYSGPGYTESVFEVSSFSTINRYRNSWQIYSYP